MIDIHAPHTPVTAIQGPKTPARRSRLRRALAVGVAVSVVTVGAAAATRAGSSPDDTVLQVTPGLATIHARGLQTVVNQSQVIDGYTAVVKEVYADATRVVVVASITAPPGRVFKQGLFPLQPPTLIDAASGNSLRMLDGADDMNGTYVDTFDARDVAATASVLHLRYSFPGISGFEPFNPSAAAPSFAGETYSQVGATRPDIGVPTRLVRKADPVAFDLSIPVNAERHEAVPNETKQLGASQLTLQRVVVTPIGVRVYVQDTNTDPEDIAAAQLTVGGKAYIPLTARPEASGLQIYDFETPLDNQLGAWSLTLQSRSQSSDAVTYNFTIS